MIKLDRKVWNYLILLFLSSYADQFWVIANGGEEYGPYLVFIGSMMFFPGLLAIVHLIRSGKGLRYIDWKLGKVKYLVMGLLVPLVITIAGIFVFDKMGLGISEAFQFNPNATVSVNDFPVLFGGTDQSIFHFILNYTAVGMLFSIAVGLLAVGEEIGWRGMLQKELLANNGLVKSIVFLGLVWGFWHAPIILNGFNYPEYPILGALVFFPLSTVGISFLFAYLTLKGASIWPAVLAHGAINSVMSLLFEMDFGANKLNANILLTAMWILIGFIAYQLLKRDRKSMKVENEPLIPTQKVP